MFFNRAWTALWADGDEDRREQKPALTALALQADGGVLLIEYDADTEIHRLDLVARNALGQACSERYRVNEDLFLMYAGGSEGVGARNASVSLVAGAPVHGSALLVGLHRATQRLSSVTKEAWDALVKERTPAPEPPPKKQKTREEVLKELPELEPTPPKPKAGRKKRAAGPRRSTRRRRSVSRK